MVTSKDIASTRRRSTSSTYKTRFACRFVRSLMKMKRSYNYRRIGGSKSNDDQESIISRRSERIKIAAYTSMARAVGTRRAWSRAFLYKLRIRNYQARLTHGAVLRKQYCLVSKKKKKKKRVIISKEPADDDDRPANNRADTLRKLVPGGESMDICSLLEETAHYIKCLATQVQVMQTVADYYSK